MKYLSKLIVILLPGILLAQRLDEMQIIDISDKPEGMAVVRDPKVSVLVVRSNIPGLRISSNNIIQKTEQVSRGKMLVWVNPGTHRFTFQASGYLSTFIRIYIPEKKSKGLEVRAVLANENQLGSNSGILDVTSDPQDMEVYIDGELFGKTPYSGKLLAGNYQLELRKETQTLFRGKFVIRVGHPTSVDVPLGPKPKPIEEKSSLLYWVGGGIITAGLTALAVIYLVSDNGGKTSSDLPTPPSYPDSN